MSFVYQYPMASHTADMVIFRHRKDDYITDVLLIRRGGEPFKGCLALPGGFMNMDETLEETAIREVREEVGINVDSMDVLYLGTFDAVNRDPRGRTISTAFSVTVPHDTEAVAGDDAAEVGWYDVEEVLKLNNLAFDHNEILNDAYLMGSI